MGSEQEQRKKWGGCLGVLSCFKSQKALKQIAPASSRIPECGNASASQPSGGVLTNQATTRAMNPAFMAPPSSPASFTNSALPSTAQSPNNYLSLSANSPGGPSSSMYATGPYAHETQLVSPPPVFSTLTTEPSTAPFTPPPELAHLTTPSSPDVPYARFLNSGNGHYNDLRSTYSLYPGSPARSPQTGVSTPLQDESNFFCPETFAKFYLDHDPSVPLNGGRLSVSKDSDVYSTNGNQNRQARQDMEELEEAYRASFGFSADDVITTSQYVEFTDVMDDSLVKAKAYSSSNGNQNRQARQDMEELEEAYRASFGFSADDVITTSQYVEFTDVMDDSLVKAKAYSSSNGQKLLRGEANLLSQTSSKSEEVLLSRNRIHAHEEALLSRVGSVKKWNRNYPAGVSSSDAEIEYRRGRSLREDRENRHRR